MEQKILLTFTVFLALLLAVRLAQRFLTPKPAQPLGFGHPESHSDVNDPDAQRAKLEGVAALAKQQAETVKTFNRENFIG